MQVGDLVRYKRWPEGSIACEGDAFNGYGIVLKKNNDGYILMRFFDVAVPSHELLRHTIYKEYFGIVTFIDAHRVIFYSAKHAEPFSTYHRFVEVLCK